MTNNPFFQLNLAPCVPPPWAKGGHAQTIWGHFLPSPMFNQRLPEQTILLPDGDQLIAHHISGDSQMVVYLFHGLGGSADSDYIHRTARVAQSQGHTVYLVNHRGCGAGAALARRPYHSGCGDDISAVIRWGRVRHPQAQHLAIGFSVSGSALLNLITGRRGDCPPDLAITVNAPIELEEASRALSQGLNRLYDLRFVLKLKDHLRTKKAAGLIDEVPKIFLTTTLRDWDETYTARAAGFDGRDHYYDTCSTFSHLDRITIPTLALTAKDDPFIPVSGYACARWSPSTRVHIEKTGGHMGYLTTQNQTGTRRWLDYALSTALNACTASIQATPLKKSV
ncbi:MAG: alpha/beta fold hydrolase [Deltaproteobacteria bacterium]|nr:alpha/beta fold hydrolase [Deltaproteobacteria bacterium]MBI3294581.1 alpha/beta fold hydrolase [Deltaproteobacteria bacterium]